MCVCDDEMCIVMQTLMETPYHTACRQRAQVTRSRQEQFAWPLNPHDSILGWITLS